MTPQEVIGKAYHDTSQAGGPMVPCHYEFGYFKDYDESCECISVANGIFEKIREMKWFLTMKSQQRHIWTEHSGDDVGTPLPFICFGCAGLFDGIGEINP